MVETDHFEESLAAALEISQKEIDHLISLKQLRKAIEEALSQRASNKFAVAGAGILPPSLPSD
jgi:hypothetical protein